MTVKDIFSIAASIIVSVGGAGVIIFGLSKWLGDLIANRLLENYKFNHERDLENLKKEYQKEIEVSKSELEKSKHKFLKYSDEQFSFYNKLWKIFWLLKNRADTVWQTKEPEALPSFAILLGNVKESVYENILVIDKKHSEKLLLLIDELEKIKFQQYQLSDLKKSKVVTVDPETKVDRTDEDEFDKIYSNATKTKIIVLTEEQVAEVLQENMHLKERFDNEILALADIFRLRMQGEQFGI